MEWQKQLNEIDALRQDFLAKRSKMKSAYNKYKREISNYQFLNTIIKPKTVHSKEEDTDLEKAVKDVFKSIGIRSWQPETDADFDILLEFDNYLIGVEVKNGNLPSENDMLQALKYKGRYNNEVHPLMIYNNAKTNQEFDKNRIKDAEINQYGVLITKDLLNGFILVKNKKITLDIFWKHLKRNGLVKFSMRAMNKAKNSEAAQRLS